MRKLLIASLLLAACGSAAATGPPSVDLTEGQLTATGLFVAGPNEIHIGNSGEFGHTLVISDADGAVIGATTVIGSGDTATLTVDLPAGAYEFTCRIVSQREDGSIVDHYQEGMVDTVEISES